MLRFCALVFTSGETLEIALYKGTNNVNILSIDEKYFFASINKFVLSSLSKYITFFSHFRVSNGLAKPQWQVSYFSSSVGNFSDPMKDSEQVFGHCKGYYQNASEANRPVWFSLTYL